MPGLRRHRLQVIGANVLAGELQCLARRQVGARTVGLRVIEDGGDEAGRLLDVETADADRRPPPLLDGQVVPGTEAHDLARQRDRHVGIVFLGRRRHRHRAGHALHFVFRGAGRVGGGVVREIDQQRPGVRLEQLEHRRQDAALEGDVVGDAKGAPEGEWHPERARRADLLGVLAHQGDLRRRQSIFFQVV